MLKAKIFGSIILMMFLCCVFISSGFAKNGPKLNNGKKWRIAYYEGGPFSEYTDTMRTLVAGLIELGWITEKNPPDYRQEMPKPYLVCIPEHPASQSSRSRSLIPFDPGHLFQ